MHCIRIPKGTCQQSQPHPDTFNVSYNDNIFDLHCLFLEIGNVFQSNENSLRVALPKRKLYKVREDFNKKKQ